MTQLSQREAATRWGIARTQIGRDIKSGKLSLTTDKRIDVAEMVRVYGEPSVTTKPATKPALDRSAEPDVTTSNQPEPVTDAIRVMLLEAELTAARAIIERQDQVIDRLGRQVDQLLLPHEKPESKKRRGWWPF